MKEIYISAYELAQITGRPLPQIIQDLKAGRIKTEEGHTQPPYNENTGFIIPLSQFYTDSWNSL